MAEKKEQISGDYQDRFIVTIHNLLDWARKDLISKHGMKVAIAAIVLMVAFSIWMNQRSSANQVLLQQTEVLGKAHHFIYSQQADSAAPILESLISDARTQDLVRSKAALLLGNIQFEKGEMDAAMANFQKVLSGAGEADVLITAAEHGIASVHMQKAEWDQAIAKFNAFVNKYGKKSGDLKARYKGEEQPDLAPTVPDALWKLALCYKESGKANEAKASVEKLLKVYGESRQAASARKFLASL